MFQSDDFVTHDSKNLLVCIGSRDYHHLVPKNTLKNVIASFVCVFERHLKNIYTTEGETTYIACRINFSSLRGEQNLNEANAKVAKKKVV